MIPAYEPGPFLLETLRSILAQDPGPEAMQIAIVDDASPTVDVASLIAGVAPAGRVEVHRNPRNLGLAGNWNRGIDLARGEFVHLLHQDDLVLPGFYSSLLDGLAADGRAGMAFCRHALIDAAGNTTRRSHLERWRPGRLRGWLARISRRQLIQCPAAIVRRSTFERLGGFRGDLVFALDWEMWVRIAVACPVWYEPGLLAAYRRHPASETSRLSRAGAVGMDTMRAITIFSQNLPVGSRERLGHRAFRRLNHVQLREAGKRLATRDGAGAREYLKVANASLERLPPGIDKWLRERKARRLERQCELLGAS